MRQTFAGAIYESPDQVPNLVSLEKTDALCVVLGVPMKFLIPPSFVPGRMIFIHAIEPLSQLDQCSFSRMNWGLIALLGLT